MTNESKLYYKTCREQAGLTQEQAVVLLGIAETATLSRYENGHTPVSQDIVGAMVKSYQTPLLAQWHVRHVNPTLAPYLPVATVITTDGDASLQMEFAIEDIAESKDALKAAVRDGKLTSDEREGLIDKAKTLRNAASQALSAATYFEKRATCN